MRRRPCHRDGCWWCGHRGRLSKELVTRGRLWPSGAFILLAESVQLPWRAAGECCHAHARRCGRRRGVLVAVVVAVVVVVGRAVWVVVVVCGLFSGSNGIGHELEISGKAVLHAGRSALSTRSRHLLVAVAVRLCLLGNKGEDAAQRLLLCEVGKRRQSSGSQT